MWWWWCVVGGWWWCLVGGCGGWVVMMGVDDGLWRVVVVMVGDGG